MITFKKPTKPAKTTTKDPETAQAFTPVQTERWTQGQTFKNRLLSTAVLLTSAAALVGTSVVVSRATTPEALPVSQTQVDFTRSDQTGAAFASGYLRTWLTASAQEHKALEAYTSELQFPSPKLPAKASGAGSIDVVQMSPRNDGLYVVTLAAQVGTNPAAAQRYFEVVLSRTGQHFAAAALPREVSAPEATSKAANGYREDVKGDALVMQTLTGFFSAYLAGDGDLQRFLTPGTAVTAVKPAPYAKVTVTAASSNTPIPTTLTDGASMDLLVRAQGNGPQSYQLSTDYELTLTARAGRWEITSMGTPHTQTTPTTNTSTSQE